MTSLPPLTKDGSPVDSLTHSLAVQRHKALGGRRTRTRHSQSTHWRTGSQVFIDTIEKIGPRTVLAAPMSLLGKVLSEREFQRAGDRFSLSRHLLKRSEVKPSEPTVPEPQVVSFLEELKGRHTGEADLVDFASKMKGIQQAVQLYCSKALGDGHRPDARVGASMVTINRKMYVFGGRSRLLFNDIKVLDPETLKWEAHRAIATVEGPPEPRVNHIAVAYKNLMVVYGGCDRFNDVLQFRNCFQLVHLYDTGEGYTVTRTWLNAKPIGQSPEPRRNHCAAVVGKHMFFYGGIDRVGKTLDDLQALDLGTLYLETMTWYPPQLVKRVKPGPRACSTLTAVYSPLLAGVYNFDIFNLPKLYDEVFTPNTCGLYLIGGINERGEASNDVYILKAKKKSIKDDRPTLVWLKLELTGQEPEARHSHSACLCGKFIFIMGGRNDSIFGQEKHCELKSIALLNVESQRWDRIEIYGTPPSGRWGSCMASIGSKVVVFGGLKLEKYCGSKISVIESDPQIVQEYIRKWKDQQTAIKKQAEMKAAFQANIAAKLTRQTTLIKP